MTQNNDLAVHIVNLENELSHINDKIKDEREENEYLRLLILDNERKEIKFFYEDSKIYPKQTQECVYELLNHNVTSSNVSPVIRTVLKLAGTTANKLPSVSTVKNMNVQRLLLSQKHLAEELYEKESTCLLSDETSKFGKKFEGFHVSDKE